MRIFILPGSIRENSSTHAVIRSILGMSPSYLQWEVYHDLGQLPHFDGAKEAPESVLQFRDRLLKADAVLIVTPEYAFGIPGSLKNALDWTVGSGELVDKPVALITASSSGEHGHAAMLLVLRAISARMTEEGKLLVPFIRSKITTGEIADPDTLQAFQRVVAALEINYKKYLEEKSLTSQD